MIKKCSRMYDTKTAHDWLSKRIWRIRRSMVNHRGKYSFFPLAIRRVLFDLSFFPFLFLESTAGRDYSQPNNLQPQQVGREKSSHIFSMIYSAETS